MENKPKMNINTRSKGLLKKASELGILCDIDICLLFYGSSSSSTAPALTFPHDPSEVSRILSHYQFHTGRVKDETQKYLPLQRTEPEINLVDSRAEMAIDCAVETEIDCATEQQIQTLVDCLDEWFAEAERIGSGEKGIKSFLRREKALRMIAEDFGALLYSVRTRILELLSRQDQLSQCLVNEPLRSRLSQSLLSIKANLEQR